MDERKNLPGCADLRSMSTAALRELLRRDLREDILDTDAACAVAKIIKERRERETPEDCPAVDLKWKSFRENYLSVKAQLRRFLRRALPKLLLLLAVLGTIALFLFLGTRPVISESVLDTIVRTEGRYSLRDAVPGMTRDELTAWLESRGFPYAEADASGFSYPGMYLRPDPDEDLRGVSWVALTGETRVAELGRTAVRRTYFFRYDILEWICLETDPVSGRIGDDISRCAGLVWKLENAFGTPDEGTAASLGTRGEHAVSWLGAERSRLDVVGRYFEESSPADAERAGRQKKTETYQIVIRITP